MDKSEIRNGWRLSYRENRWNHAIDAIRYAVTHLLKRHCAQQELSAIQRRTKRSTCRY